LREIAERKLQMEKKQQEVDQTLEAAKPLEVV